MTESDQIDCGSCGAPTDKSDLRAVPGVGERLCPDCRDRVSDVTGGDWGTKVIK